MSLADSVIRLIEALRSAMATGLPAPPQWLTGFPLVGPRLTEAWANVSRDAATTLHPYVGTIRDWLLARGPTCPTAFSRSASAC